MRVTFLNEDYQFVGRNIKRFTKQLLNLSHELGIASEVSIRVFPCLHLPDQNPASVVNGADVYTFTCCEILNRLIDSRSQHRTGKDLEFRHVIPRIALDGAETCFSVVLQTPVSSGQVPCEVQGRGRVKR